MHRTPAPTRAALCLAPLVALIACAASSDARAAPPEATATIGPGRVSLPATGLAVDLPDLGVTYRWQGEVPYLSYPGKNGATLRRRQAIDVLTLERAGEPVGRIEIYVNNLYCKKGLLPLLAVEQQDPIAAWTDSSGSPWNRRFGLVGDSLSIAVCAGNDNITLAMQMRLPAGSGGQWQDEAARGKAMAVFEPMVVAIADAALHFRYDWRALRQRLAVLDPSRAKLTIEDIQVPLPDDGLMWDVRENDEGRAISALRLTAPAALMGWLAINSKPTDETCTAGLETVWAKQKGDVSADAFEAPILLEAPAGIDVVGVSRVGEVRYLTLCRALPRKGKLPARIIIEMRVFAGVPAADMPGMFFPIAHAVLREVATIY